MTRFLRLFTASVGLLVTRARCQFTMASWQRTRCGSCGATPAGSRCRLGSRRVAGVGAGELGVVDVIESAVCFFGVPR